MADHPDHTAAGRSALYAIAATPPALSQAELRRLLADGWDLEGDLEPLVSERDQNVRVRCANGDRFVLKIAAASEPEHVTDLQVRALENIAREARVPAPRIVRTRDNNALVTVRSDQGAHAARVVTWLEGTPMASTESTPAGAQSLGKTLAVLDRALAGVTVDADNQVLIWDMQRAGELREVIDCIADQRQRELVADAIDRFESELEPAFATLRRQLIHNDVNPGNVLTDSENGLVSGLLDFGDMLIAPLIVEVAIAASYLRHLDDDPLTLIAPFVAAYHAESPLADAELALLYDLVRLRLATTTALLWWRLREKDPDDPYRRQTLAAESSAAEFAERLDGLGRAAFTAELKRACDRQALL